MSSKEEDAEYEKYKKRYTLSADPKSVWLKRRRETEKREKLKKEEEVDYDTLSIPEKIAYHEKYIAEAESNRDFLVKKAEERGKYDNLEPELIRKMQEYINFHKGIIRKINADLEYEKSEKKSEEKPKLKPPPKERKRVVEVPKKRLITDDIEDEDEPVTEIKKPVKPVEEPKLLWINEPLAVYENIFIETTAIGALELEDVKGKWYIPESAIVGKFKEISPKDLEDDFLRLQEIDPEPNIDQDDENPIYFLSIPPQKITLDKTSPYYFKTISYRNDTPIYIKLGKFKRKNDIPFYIPKKDIKLKEFDEETSPFGEDYFEDDEYTAGKWKKYLKQRTLGITLNPDFKKEVSAFEGVSKKSSAEKELAKYLSKPKKSKPKDEPLSVLDVLERLPIPEGDRKEEISQLKKMYDKKQLDEPIDVESIKQVVKIVKPSKEAKIKIITSIVRPVLED